MVCIGKVLLRQNQEGVLTYTGYEKGRMTFRVILPSSFSVEPVAL